MPSPTMVARYGADSGEARVALAAHPYRRAGPRRRAGTTFATRSNPRFTAIHTASHTMVTTTRATCQGIARNIAALSGAAMALPNHRSWR